MAQDFDDLLPPRGPRRPARPAAAPPRTQPPSAPPRNLEHGPSDPAPRAPARRRWLGWRLFEEAPPARDGQWEALLAEEIASIDIKVDAFDETLRKSIPEIEQRVLHLIEGKFQALELGVARRLTAAQEQLGRLEERLARSHALVSFLLSLVLLILAVLLFRV